MSRFFGAKGFRADLGRFSTPGSPGKGLARRGGAPRRCLPSGEIMSPRIFRLLLAAVPLLIAATPAHSDAWDYKLFTPDYTLVPPGPDHDRIVALREELLSANNRDDVPAALSYAQQILSLSNSDLFAIVSYEIAANRQKGLPAVMVDPSRHFQSVAAIVQPNSTTWLSCSWTKESQGSWVGHSSLVPLKKISPPAIYVLNGPVLYAYSSERQSVTTMSAIVEQSEIKIPMGSTPVEIEIDRKTGSYTTTFSPTGAVMSGVCTVIDPQPIAATKF